MRGGRPKPETLKISEGTYRKDRAKKNQPKASGVPKCPFGRGSIAATKWKEVVGGLKRLGIVDEIDATHIEGLCRSYQMAKEADAQVDSEGMVIVGAKGTPIKHPAVQVSADAWHKVRMYCNDLGLNHLSRQRMETTATEETAANEYIA